MIILYFENIFIGGSIMKDIHKPKLGGGILTLAIIQLIFNGIGLTGLVMTLLMIYAPKTYGVTTVPTFTVIVTLVSMLITTLGIILILMKKKLGIYIYFINEVANIVYSVVINGFKPVILVSLIIPVFMGILILTKKEIFATETKA